MKKMNLFAVLLLGISTLASAADVETYSCQIGKGKIDVNLSMVEDFEQLVLADHEVTFALESYSEILPATDDELAGTKAHVTLGAYEDGKEVFSYTTEVLLEETPVGEVFSGKIRGLKVVCSVQ